MHGPVTLSGSSMANLISLSPRSSILQSHSLNSVVSILTIKHGRDLHLVSPWQKKQLLLAGWPHAAKKVLPSRSFLRIGVQCHHRHHMGHPSFIIDIDLGAQQSWTAGGDTGPGGNIGWVPAEPHITVLPVSISILGDPSQVWSRIRTSLLFGKRARRHYVPTPVPR